MNERTAVLVDGEIHYRAVDRHVQSLVPGSILARRKNGHGKAIAVARKDA